jgi:amidohydrolase
MPHFCVSTKDMLQQKIRSLAKQYAPDYIDIRHHLHAHPELSYQEFETSAYIQKQLSDYGIPFTVMATTGVVGIIEGKDPTSRIVALRADMDALPINEENDVPYRSTRPGIMHACGHDVHTTCLLGAAKILQETKDLWSGTIKLVFQPGEEKNPGGASLMIKDGVLDHPVPQAIMALHVNPQLEQGKLSFRAGKVMASADEIYMTLKGKGGHAAAPHLTTDLILTASQLIVSLQQVISRNCDPFSPSVLSITSFHGGFTTNVIPSEVKLMGTFRAMDEEWRFKAHDIIRKHSKELVEALGATIDVNIDVGYPTVYNHEKLNEAAKEIATEYLPAGMIEETEMRMGAEDFGYYSQLIPGCFFRLGTGNIARGITSGVHTPRFDIDENAIETGIGIMAFMGATISLDR